jgi:hypothetical protein
MYGFFKYTLKKIYLPTNMYFGFKFLVILNNLESFVSPKLFKFQGIHGCFWGMHQLHHKVQDIWNTCKILPHCITLLLRRQCLSIWMHLCWGHEVTVHMGFMWKQILRSHVELWTYIFTFIILPFQQQLTVKVRN